MKTMVSYYHGLYSTTSFRTSLDKRCKEYSLNYSNVEVAAVSLIYGFNRINIRNHPTSLQQPEVWCTEQGRCLFHGSVRPEPRNYRRLQYIIVLWAPKKSLKCE